MQRIMLWLGTASLMLLVGCLSTPPSLPVCVAASSPNSICGLMNPEDLDVLPGGDWIVVSQMAHLDREAEANAKPSRAGNLLAIHGSRGDRKTLFPGQGGWPLNGGESGQATSSWGEPDCGEAPDPAFFQPHGIATGRHASGVPMLAVVNHGGREAVELFEIDAEDEPTIAWRGCVRMPEGMTNDLALFPDGGFVVTKMMPSIENRGAGALWTGFKIWAGWNTGEVYRWSPGGAVTRVEASEGSAPNGIAIAPDQSALFVAEWADARIYRIGIGPRAGEPRKSVDLDYHPDNLTWMRDGRLLVAGQGGSLSGALGCGKIERGGCGLDYGLYAIDPDSLEATLLATGKGAASVALELEDEIFVGAFSGDRIDRVPRPR